MERPETAVAISSYHQNGSNSAFEAIGLLGNFLISTEACTASDDVGNGSYLFRLGPSRASRAVAATQDNAVTPIRRYALTPSLPPHRLRMWIFRNTIRLCDRLIAIPSIPMMRIKKEVKSQKQGL